MHDPVLVFKLNSLSGSCEQSSWTSQLVLLQHHHEDGEEHDEDGEEEEQHHHHEDGEEDDEHACLVLQMLFLAHLISALLLATVRVDHSRLKQKR